MEEELARPVVRIHAIKCIAREMSIPEKAALRIRMRYLHEQLQLWDHWLGCQYAFFHDYPYADVPTICKEIQAIKKALNEIEKPPGQLTDEEVKYAEAYPIDKLIEFKHGKCHCPFHDDKSPSMYFAHRKNIACCPVCGSGWNAIRYTMKRDGINFYRAVKYLCER